MLANETIDRIALIGAHPASNLLAPFNDRSWTIWACSPTNASKLARVDAWFELHGDLRWPDNASWAFDYTLWLQNQAFPVYAIDQSVIPRAITFPKDEMIRQFGTRHFTSSFAWMLAYAITKQPKQIALFGIDMNTTEEYSKQRAGFQHFMDIAERFRGIQLLAPDESDILQPAPLYGYDRTTAFTRKLAVRKKEYQDRMETYKRKREEYSQQIASLQGSIQELEYMETIWTGCYREPDNQVGPADWYPTATMVDTQSLMSDNAPSIVEPVAPRPSRSPRRARALLEK